MFFTRKAKARAEQVERERDAQLEQAAADLHHLKQRARRADERIEERVRRNHISEAVAMLIQGAS